MSGIAMLKHRNVRNAWPRPRLAPHAAVFASLAIVAIAGAGRNWAWRSRHGGTLMAYDVKAPGQQRGGGLQD